MRRVVVAGGGGGGTCSLRTAHVCVRARRRPICRRQQVTVRRAEKDRDWSGWSGRGRTQEHGALVQVTWVHGLVGPGRRAWPAPGAEQPLRQCVEDWQGRDAMHRWRPFHWSQDGTGTGKAWACFTWVGPAPCPPGHEHFCRKGPVALATVLGLLCNSGTVYYLGCMGHYWDDLQIDQLFLQAHLRHK